MEEEEEEEDEGWVSPAGCWRMPRPRAPRVSDRVWLTAVQRGMSSSSAAGSEAPKRCGAWCVVSKMRMALEAWVKACEGWEEEEGSGNRNEYCSIV